MTIAGLALAGLGATLQQSAFEMEGMSVITAGLMSLGVVLAVSGGAGAIWARGSGYSDLRLTVMPGMALMALLLFAAALPLALATQLGPLTSYWRDVMRLASEYRVWESANGPAALVFVPVMGVLLVPILEAAAAGVVALTCGLLLVLVLVRSAAVLKLSAIGTLLAGGLTAACWLGVGATERLAPGVETLIRTPDLSGQEQAQALALLQRQRAVGSGSAWTVSWAWAALALLAVGTRSVARGDTAEHDRAMALDAASLDGLDEATRAQALLDAADRLHRTTPPVRRF